MDEREAVELVEESLAKGNYIPRGGDVYQSFQIVLELAKRALEILEEDER
jgi:hypothetical protein